MTELKTTTVSFEDYTYPDFVPPANYFIKTALGDYLFVHTRNRQLAQEFIDEYAGVKGKYKVNASRIQKTTKDVTAR